MALLVLGSSALADGVARVVLLGPSESDPTAVRLRRELEILGIDVELVPTVDANRRDRADVAREHHAVAVVALEPSPPAIVLWIDPARYSSGTTGPEIRVDEGLVGSTEHRLLVLRAVEILRERLLPVSVLPPTLAEAGAVEVSDASVTAAPPLAPADSGAPGAADMRTLAPLPSRSRPSIFLAPAVLASPGGLAATPHVWLGARWAPVGRIDLEIVAFVPVTAASVSAPEGSMALRAGALGAGASVRLTDPASSLFIGAGAGLGAMLAAFEGQAHPPWHSASGLRGVMLPDVHASAGYWLLPRLALRADALTGFALPEPALWIAGRRVAVLGEPAALFAAGIEVRM